MKILPPAWFLFLFAPMTAEYVSGSSPYLNPFVWLGNFFLYGAGTILIRELRVRWGKGWLSVFILAAAYMVAEEGLMLNTLFDPLQNTAGRSLGVNWVWTAGMLQVHTFVSIFAPIMLAELVYHARADEPWVRPRTFWWLLVGFVANIFGLGRLIAPYNRPGILWYLAEAVFIALCLWLAWRSPAPREGNNGPAERSPLRLFLAVSAGMTVMTVLGFATPAIEMPPVVKVAVMILIYLGFLGLLRWCGAFRPQLDPLSKLAIAGGIISFWILVSPLTALSKHKVGPLFFGVLVAILLIKVQQRLRKGLPIPWAQKAV
ncbi:MAG: hypothetical protein ACLQVY_07770 [Limisphaerales bacterium]